MSSFIEIFIEILTFIANSDLSKSGAGALNILGALWLLILMVLTYMRLKPQFSSSLPKPKGHKKLIWFFCLVALSYTYIFLMQQILSEVLEWNIFLAFGSWSLVESYVGPLSLLKVLNNRAEMYISIILICFVFTYYGFWRLFHFTKESAFWLLATIALLVLLGSQHNYNFRVLQGYDRMIAFWLSYPEFRILTGFFVASTLKKKVTDSTPLWALRFG